MSAAADGNERRALRLAVIGDPVEHSQSPALHRGFLRAAGREGSYEAIRIVAGNGASGIAELRARGFTGANVTTPLKEEAYAASDRVDELARQLRAANTLVFTSEAVYGFNTDGAGARGALSAAGVTENLTGQNLLVLGAGATARAAVAAFAGTGANLVIWNRTQTKAEVLARSVAGSVEVWYDDHEPGASRPFCAVFSTLVPNADLPLAIEAALMRAPVVIDANYGARATLGARLRRTVHDGSAMLRASAAASFALWSSDPDDEALRRMTVRND